VRKEEWTSLDIHEVLENSLKIVCMVTKAGLVERE